MDGQKIVLIRPPDPWSALVSKARKWTEEQHLPAHTLRTRFTAWGIYLSWASSTRTDVLQADQKDGQAYLAYLTSRYSAPASVMNRIAQVRALYLCWQELGERITDPFEGLSLPANQPAARRRVFNEEEVTKLLSIRGNENQVLLLLGLRLGLRASTLIKLCWEDLDLQRFKITLSQPVSELPLDRHTGRVLKRLVIQRETLGQVLSGPLFPNLRSAEAVNVKLKILCKQKDVSPQPWGALRNTSGLYRNSKKIRILRKNEMEFKSVRPIEYLEQKLRLELEKSHTRPENKCRMH